MGKRVTKYYAIVHIATSDSSFIPYSLRIHGYVTKQGALLALSKRKEEYKEIKYFTSKGLVTEIVK